MSYLLMLKGPHPGARFDIDRERTFIGRDSLCQVPLRKNVVSKRHALITQAGDGLYYLEDGNGEGQGSHNFTYLNGQKLIHPDRRQLHNDDLITICGFVLLFHDSSDSDSDPSSINGTINNDSSIVLTQPAERLRLLLELTNRLNNTLELDRLTNGVVDVLMNLFRQADRAFLILVDEASGALVSRSRKTRTIDPDLPEKFSTRIVEQCLKTVQGLLSNNVREDHPESDSLVGLGVRSVMCAPLWSKASEAFGVLYLDTQNDRKPFTQDDLNLLMGVANQASIALTNARLYRDALARERMNRDLVLAREVVRSFVPDRLPNVPGYAFFAKNESALEVGGDYFDFVAVAGSRLAVLVGDVVGKGVPAALVMARFSADARACLRGEADLAAAVRQLNDLTGHLSATDRFVTLAALVLDPATHTLTVVNAGHPSPLLLRRATGTLHEITARADVAPPLAVIDGYPYDVHQAALAPGDSVVIYSDGVTDAQNVAGHQFGLDRLRGVLQDGAAEPQTLGERVLRAVQEHAAGCAQYDDITLVCLGRTT